MSVSGSPVPIVLVVMLELAACTGGTSPDTAGSNANETDLAVIGGSGGGGSSGGTAGNESAGSNCDTNDRADCDEQFLSMEPTQLDGDWIKPCVLINPDEPDEGYRIWTLTFEGNRFSSHIRNFTTPGCTSASAIYSQIIFQGYFEFGDSLTSSEGLAVKRIDVHTQTPVANIEYDIFHQNGSKLYFGDTSGQTDGTTEENRPDSLDFYWDLTIIE